MQRPRQHEIDTEACNALRVIIPSSSVLREIEHDYGLDFQIELFDNKKSTGKMFYLQLKGTDVDVKSNKVSYSLKTEHIEYYSIIPDPILFVIYSTKTSQFWAIWANELKSIYSPKQLSQKTIKITLDGNNLINRNFFMSLQKSFNANIPNKTNVTFSLTTENEQKLKEQIVKWLNHYYQHYIEFDNYLLPKNIHFNISTRTTTELEINVKKNNMITENLTIDISNKSFLFFPVINPNQPSAPLNKTLILISSIFYKYDLKNSIEILISNLFDNVPNPNFIIDLVKECIKQNYIFDLQRLTQSAIEYKNSSVTELINTCLVAFDELGSFSKLYQENLTKFIDTLDDNQSRGISHYNLANSYMMNSEYYLASKFYQKARKYEPAYLKKAYWWREYASVLFLSGHYYFAEKFYRKCHSLDENFDMPKIFALIGDTLFLQGKFNEAKIEYEKFLGVLEQSKYRIEISLKTNVCDFMISQTLDGIKFNTYESEIHLMTALANFNSINTESLLESAINKYPVNALAWYNYGIYQSQKENWELAFMAFLITSFIDEWDTEAWKNSLWCAMNCKKLLETSAILEIVLQKFGNNILNTIIEDILKQPNHTEQEKNDLISLFSEIPEIREEIL